MKLCASNIAWEKGDDENVYDVLNELGFHGLEIAPTRWVPENPYDTDNRTYCRNKAEDIEDRWGLHLASMQSIWYGRTENIFGNEDERQSIYAYMCKAIDFAKYIHCPHIVFGCPKNRNVISENSLINGIELIIAFAEYAKKNGVVIGLEANPVIYGTNFVNTNADAASLVREVNLSSLRLNLDIGAFIYNKEKLDDIRMILDVVSHIHISEPFLELIVRREEHKSISDMLLDLDYQGYISLEMKKCSLPNLIDSVKYMREVF
ncbi:sugar phosphate isomerase/epimerase family protein [Aeromonas hydrophila]|uniref:sugar phosphate isomerase/epimerase family protein n=1 Tax=Aeromonas hydrophila TaxID=644 RepID=UPI0022AE7AEB|nr:sugar phosphate isomerase/epimerase family protein [Aeromonas hydrophila]ELB2793011.1 sugar phosphate isomerase/epimerase [Aeromonas hydrophila]MCZ4332386.1 sugar phosphate isomerase/epimerase [Aeromonas hydrophila]